MIGRSEYTKTRTGIVIGGAWVEPSPAPGSDAELVQSALLGQERANIAERALDAVEGAMRFIERRLGRIVLLLIVGGFAAGVLKRVLL